MNTLRNIYDIHNGFGGAVCDKCLPREMDRLGGYGGRYAVNDTLPPTVTRCGVCLRTGQTADYAQAIADTLAGTGGQP